MSSKRFSDGIRQVIDELRSEDDLQKRVTARIVGAAAQLANHHDHLIEEVAEVTRQDLASLEAARTSKTYTVESLKQRFKSFGQAKAHFGLKAKGWADLATRLNRAKAQNIATEISQQPQSLGESELAGRLAQIEQKLGKLQEDVQKILMLIQAN